MFRALLCSSSGGLRRNCIYAASGIVTLCRWLSCAPVKKENHFFLFFDNNSDIKRNFRSEYIPYCCLVCIQDWAGEGNLVVVKVLDRRLYCVARREQTLIGMWTDWTGRRSGCLYGWLCCAVLAAADDKRCKQGMWSCFLIGPWRCWLEAKESP